MDLGGQITSWNRGAESLFGYTSDEVTGKPAALLYGNSAHAEHEPDWTPDVVARMHAGLPADYQLETVRRRKDGSLVEVLLSCAGIRDTAGALTGMSIIARDIGRRKAAERARARPASTHTS